jgi:hypothetical protein
VSLALPCRRLRDVGQLARRGARGAFARAARLGAADGRFALTFLAPVGCRALDDARWLGLRADFVPRFADPRLFFAFCTVSSGTRGPTSRRRSRPSRARSAPAPAYAPATPSAAAEAPGRRASSRTSAAVPVPDASAARAPAPPTIAAPAPACRTFVAISRRARSTCWRARTTACSETVCTNSSSGRSLNRSTADPVMTLSYPRTARTENRQTTGWRTRRVARVCGD